MFSPFSFFFLATPCGMWDLSFLTKDWTLFWKHRVLTTGLPGKSCFSLGFSASLSLPVYLGLSGYLSIYTYIYLHLETSLVAQMVKRLSTMRETWFDPWVGKIPWRRKWQSTPGLLPGKISWTEEPGRLQSTGLQRVGHDCATSLFTSIHRYEAGKNILSKITQIYWKKLRFYYSEYFQCL